MEEKVMAWEKLDLTPEEAKQRRQEFLRNLSTETLVGSLRWARSRYVCGSAAVIELLEGELMRREKETAVEISGVPEGTPVPGRTPRRTGP